jgi:hypothetical protein
MILITLLVTWAGCALSACEQPAKETRPPSLRRVVLYSSGLTTGSIALDVGSRTITALGSRLLRAEKCIRIQARLKDSELAEVKKLADWLVFRDLVPCLFWFKSHTPLVDEVYPDLLIVWEDKDVVYQVRSREELRDSTEEWVRLVYDRMNAVGNRLLELALKYGREPANVKELWDNEIDQMCRELAREHAKSKP